MPKTNFKLIESLTDRFRAKNFIIKSDNEAAKHIKINFSDFWPNFNKEKNYLVELLKISYTLEITDKPDFLIYSVFGKEHKKFNCIKIFYTGENVRPNFAECHYSFSFDFINSPKSYMLPLYAWWAPANELIKQPGLDAEKILSEKTRFCNFIYGNPYATKRIAFMQKLSKYKQVDSAGTFMNNVGRIVTEMEKVEFIKDYKFTIAFENTEYPGYTTEKLVQPMLAYSLPIYCGNPLVGRDFNAKSFLNYADFSSEEELIDRIIEIDQNDELYMEYLRQPYYHNNQVNEFIDPENILRQFRIIFEKAVLQSA
jgi:alpha(1,3/1,4) fucosyltransferase